MHQFLILVKVENSSVSGLELFRRFNWPSNAISEINAAVTQCHAVFNEQVANKLNNLVSKGIVPLIMQPQPKPKSNSVPRYNHKRNVDSDHDYNEETSVIDECPTSTSRVNQTETVSNNSNVTS